MERENFRFFSTIFSRLFAAAFLHPFCAVSVAFPATKRKEPIASKGKVYEAKERVFSSSCVGWKLCSWEKALYYDPVEEKQ